jgi:retron-type reverse transcriptase
MMFEIFTKDEIAKVYLGLKTKKHLDRNKKLPIGIDGVSTDVFERNLDYSLNEIHRKLLVKDGIIDYKFSPLLRIEKVKSHGGVRALHIPRLRDQIVLRLVHNEILQLAEQKGINLKVGSPYSFVNNFDRVIRQNPQAVILKTDISQFYDTIPRVEAIKLCESLGLRKELLELMRNWSENLRIRPSNFYGNVDFVAFSGLPQGLSVSSLLAELYVRQIDQGYTNEHGYFRYIDDVVIVCRDSEDAHDKLESLKHSINTLGLKLSPHKTEILRIKDGLEWLGLVHYPDKKLIHPEKLIRTARTISFLQKECLQVICNSNNEREKIEAINKFIREADKFITGNKKVRLKWYSLVDDNGQWKLMDKYIHGLINSCIRKVGLDKNIFGQLPSIHAKILSYKKIKGSQNSPN